jgi:hypothetical protein
LFFFALDCGAKAKQWLVTQLINQKKQAGHTNEESIYYVLSMGNTKSEYSKKYFGQI